MKRFCLSFLFLLFSLPAFGAPEIQEVVSPGGLKAWLLQSDRLPLLSVAFAFRGGVEADPQDKQGLATLTASLLTQGAGPYDDKSFQDRLAALSIRLDISAGRDAIAGEMKTLRRHKDEAFRLLGLSLTQPRFDEASFARAKNQQRAALRFQIAEPEWQGRYALFQTLFGEHPYAFRSLGSSQSLKKIERKDAAAFARQRLAKDNLLIAVAGDVTPKELGALLDRAFGGLPARAAPLDVPAFVWPDKPVSVLVRRTGEQTNIFFAAPMPERQDPDWYAAQVANYILGGGGFMSRLMKEAREKEGLTYGIGTSLASMEKASFLLGGLATGNEKAGEALALVRDVWREAFENGASGEEIEAAKAYLTGSLPLKLTSTDGAASVLLSLRQDRLERDFLAAYPGLIEKVSKKDVDRVLKTWFDPSRVFFSFVGEPRLIEADKMQALIGD